MAVDTAETKLTNVNSIKSVMDTATTNYQSMPKLTTDVIDTIEDNLQGTSVFWKELGYADGHFELTFVAENEEEPDEVIANFFEQDVFDNITYTGFEENETTSGYVLANQETNGYVFTVMFDMREAEIEEDAAAEEAPADAS